MANDSGPLSKAQVDELITNIRRMDSTIAQIERAIRAGVPVEEQLALAKETKARMLKLKGEYAPTRSL
jgi:outer membrane murein-binding lipoprotein Lpp